MTSLDHELAVFASALAEGDLTHALEHLGNAAVLAPVEPRVLGAIETAVRRCDLLEMVSDSDLVRDHVLRAHGLRHEDRFNEAVELLCEVAVAMPHVGFERVLARWLTLQRTGGAAPRPAAWHRVASLLATVAQSTVGIHRLLPGEQALLAGYEELAVACASCSPPGTVAVVVSGLLRRFGRIELALGVVEALDDLDPTMIHTQRGLALRARGDGAAAAEAFAAAAAVDPGPVYVLEQARSWFVAGDHARAQALLAQLPSIDAEAAALARACEGPALDDPVAALDGLRRAALAPPIEQPPDATLNALRNHAAQLGPPPHPALRVGVSGWESPSSRLLVALYTTGTGDVARAEYALGPRALPIDPAGHRRGDGAPVWIARDGVVVPAGPSPAPALRRELADVAIGDDGLRALWQRAGALAARLDGGQAAEVARAMVHPPEDRGFLATLPEGLYRYQVACACVLAQLPAPWSVRAPVLTSLLFGPIDWVSGATVLALGQLALQDAEAATAIQALLVDAIEDLLPHSCEPRAIPLLEVLPRLPVVPFAVRPMLRAWFEQNRSPERKDEGNGKAESVAAPQRAADVPRAPLATSSQTSSSVGPWVAAAVGLLVLLGWLLR